MKTNVVDEVLLRIIQRSVHLSDLFSHYGQVIGLSMLSRESSKPHLEQLARFKHFIGCEAVKLGEHSQWLTIQRRRTFSDISAGAVARCQDANSGEKSQPMPQAGSADSQALRQFTFWWQPITGFEGALADHIPNLNDDLFGHQAILFWSDHLEPAEFNGTVVVSAHFFSARWPRLREALRLAITRVRIVIESLRCIIILWDKFAAPRC